MIIIKAIVAVMLIGIVWIVSVLLWDSINNCD
jgi:hypothetical protein